MSGSTATDVEDAWLACVVALAQRLRQRSNRRSESGAAAALGRAVQALTPHLRRAAAGDEAEPRSRAALPDRAPETLRAQAGGAIIEWLVGRGPGDDPAGASDPWLRRAVYRWLAASVAPSPVASAAQPARLLATWSTALERAAAVDGKAALLVFSGPAGSGRTLAAHWLAARLDRPLQRVDIGPLVDKYIGETEKNLATAIARAEAAGAVLLFDEADALFGKRTAVDDSHDRYASVETSHLLQRIERFEGLAILATNLPAPADAIDPDLRRRLKVWLTFPLPLPPAPGPATTAAATEGLR